MKAYLIQSHQVAGHKSSMYNLFVVNAEDEDAVKKMCIRLSEFAEEVGRAAWITDTARLICDSGQYPEFTFLANYDLIEWIFNHDSIVYLEYPVMNLCAVRC